MKKEITSINPGGSYSVESHEQNVKNMFNSITSTYDLLNRLMSLRQDVSWRRKMIENLPENLTTVLDVATGTGDVALESIRQFPRVKVIGVDIAVNMLKAAKEKVSGLKLPDRVNLLGGNTMNLPFGSAAFNAVTIAFGLRNVFDHHRALCEMYRVLKPQGKVIILDLSFAPSGLLRPIINLYFKTVLPLMGLFIARDRQAYTYLPDSIRKFLSPEDLKKMMISIGFSEVKLIPLAFGIVHLHVGKKPAANEN